VELTTGGPERKLTLANGAVIANISYRVRRGSGEQLTAVRVQIDGRPSFVKGLIPKDDGQEVLLSVPVPPHQCSVGIIAENRFASSEATTIRVIPTLSQASEKDTQKHRLMILSIGVNIHLNDGKEMDRLWSKNDAEDMVTALQKQAPKFYRDVQYRLLTDKDATASNILDGFDWLRKESTPDDVVIILLMGHGGNDERNRFFFVPYDFDPERPARTSVGFEEIQRCLSNLPGRVLLFVGSCHSGNVGGRLTGEAVPMMDTTQLTNALASDENGVVVFTASTGRQTAWSTSELRNSLFFEAVLEGLGGKADLLGKGTISVSSLDTYVSARVPELFNKYIGGTKDAKEEDATAQTPTVAKPQTIPDFTIALRTSK
jgi:hypothetical protein